MVKKDIDTDSEDLDLPDDDAARPAAKKQDLKLKLNSKTESELDNLGQAPLPSGQLKQPDVQAPDMAGYQADRQAYAQSKLPQTGALNPTMLNNDQYSQTQLSNLEGMKGLTQQGADLAGQTSDNDAAILAQSNADQIKMQQAQMFAGKKAMDDSESRVNDMKKQVDAAAAENVDPNHWFNSKSTGGKIAAAIGTFLMGLYDPKMAMEHIHKSINEDMDAQRENISNHWNAIKEAHNIDDTAFNRAAHDQEWRQQYRLGALEVVKGQLQQNAAQSKNPMFQNNAKMAIQQISQQQDQIRHQNWLVRQQALVAASSNQIATQNRLRTEAAEARKQQVELMNNSSAPMSEKDAAEAVGRMHPDLVQYGLWGSGGGQMNPNAPTTNSEKTAARENEKDLENRTVSIPDAPELGLKPGTAVASNAANKHDFDERVRGTVEWMKKLQDVEMLNDKWKNGTLTQEDLGTWHSLDADLINTMNGTFAVTRTTTDAEGERIKEDMIPKPPSTFARVTSVNNLGYTGNYDKQANDGKIAAMKKFMPGRIQQAMGDLTPLKDTQSVSQGAADYSYLGFKHKPLVSGTRLESIPNNFQDNTTANSPGIPSFNQYQRSR